MDRQTRHMRGYRRRVTLTVCAWLIFCCPIGLFIMWSKRCHFRNSAKYAITALAAVVVVWALNPLTLFTRSDRLNQTAGAMPVAFFNQPFGPQPPDDFVRDDYLQAINGLNPALPTPDLTTSTPAPVVTPVPKKYVYTNSKGQYYHRASCRSYNASSKRRTIQEATKAGFLPCEVCRPGTA